MKRFLDGDQLPQELLDDLEKHLKACPNCKEVVTNEKVSLEEVLDGPSGTSNGFGAILQKVGLKTQTAGGFATAYPTQALIQASRTSVRTTPPGHAAFKNPKVLLLSGALAIVLIAMTTILKDPTKLLGPRATVAATTSEKDTDQKDAAEKDETHSDPAKEETTHDSSDSTHADPDATDEHSDEKPHDDSTHAADETITDDGTHSETPPSTDTHASTESTGHATNSHDLKPNEPTPQPKETKTPGQPTINHDTVIIVGPSGTQTKSTNPPAKTPAKKPATPTKKTNSTKKKSTSTKSRTSTPSKKKSSSSGIKVYDQNGKQIR